MALVREHGGYGGFDSAEAAAFDALGYGYGYGHGALLGFDASAALFGEGASAYVSDAGDAWTGAGSSTVLAFDRNTPAAAAAAAAAVVEEEEEESDAWIDAMDQSYGAGAATAPEARHALTSSVGFDASTGCFTLTERSSPSSSSGGAGRPFGLLFPSTSSGAGGTPERAAAAPVRRAPQKRTYVVRAAPTQFCSRVWTGTCRLTQNL